MKCPERPSHFFAFAGFFLNFQFTIFFSTIPSLFFASGYTATMANTNLLNEKRNGHVFCRTHLFQITNRFYYSFLFSSLLTMLKNAKEFLSTAPLPALGSHVSTAPLTELSGCSRMLNISGKSEFLKANQANSPLSFPTFHIFPFLPAFNHFSNKHSGMNGATSSLTILGLALLAACAMAGQQMPEFGQPLPFPDSQFIDLISRDIESVSGPIAYGHKYMTGGAGEGDQQLQPEGSFEHRQEVKSDNVLPAYCEPPNPCPVGFTGRDGCLEEFENTADFSRNYQAQQQCLCDQEHMFNCPTKNTAEQYEQDMEQVLAKNGLHKSMMAKKFHLTRAEEPRRRKRSAAPESAANPPSHAHSRFNPYLEGEPLHSVSKKDGRNLPQQM